MTPNEYQQLAARTIPKDKFPSEKELLNLGALGLAGETGEVVDIIKKDLFHGRPLNKEDMFHELGDVAWYLAALCTALGFDFEDVLQGNIDKLKARWPEGFKVGETPVG